ncbi:hypothetical protein [Pseudothioclava arenosa]|uniref:Uncharacterized protein n=1 Tax=Pseudothioclava arenosa TaxID=1795308 RepID=A0A2A4CSL2_9RHOB|nr:hypothetical protein [Pseudothioclava arenosa]PCD77106.1 hypothetical protein CLN94_04845 [Pseudothioclava arenosa]
MAADHATAPVKSSTAWIIALFLIATAAGATVVFGLGGLIMWGVIATWVMMALLVVMTAGS